MFEDYSPKRFCRDLAGIRGHSNGLTIIMAVIKGVKPAADDWIRVGKYDAYQKACKRYGLIVRPDAVFRVVESKKIPAEIIGREYLTSTKAFGFSLNTADRNDSLHVFISRSKKHLEASFSNGWYPLVIKNRVIDKPLIDSFRFGYNLGYPDCCVNFFQRYNNWSAYSYLYEVFKNSSHGKYSFLCNPFTKDDAYSYVYHMPCSYSCRETVRLAKQIRRCIYEEEREFAERIDRHLKLPFLVFYERKFYAFEGEIRNKRIHYKKTYFVGRMAGNNLYEEDLNRGDCVFVDGNDVVISKNGKLIKVIKNQKKNFASETPFIIQFE